MNWSRIWGSLPNDWKLGQTAIAVDSRDHVYLFNRSEHPLIVLSSDGQFLRSWGEDFLTSSHGIFVDDYDMIYLCIPFSHVVLKCDVDGHVIMKIGGGSPSNPAWEVDDHPDPQRPWLGSPGQREQLFTSMRDPVKGAYGPFTMPTDISVDRDGSIFCSDGYGNFRDSPF